MRGLITAVWLERLEQKLGGPIHRYFDLVAGSSTGAILAAGVSMAVPARDLVRMYQERAREIFPSLPSQLWSRFVRTFDQGLSVPKYSDQGLERVLREYFGPATFGQLKIKPTLITTYDTIKREARVFRNIKPEYKPLPVWKLVKASASAPTYFPATALKVEGQELSLIDGGVVANNPTACAIAEAVKFNHDEGTGSGLEDLVVLSMGTGHQTRTISLKEAQGWGPVQWMLPVIDVLMDGSADATDHIAAQVLQQNHYIRMQVALSRGLDDLDDASATNLWALEILAQEYLKSQGGDQLLDQAVRQVAAER